MKNNKKQYSELMKVIEKDLCRIITKHLNELSPDYIRSKADKAEKLLNNKNIVKRISAWQYAKCLKQISDFRNIADNMVAAINNGNIGNQDQEVPTDAEIQTALETPVEPVPSKTLYSPVDRKESIKGIRKKSVSPVVPDFPGADDFEDGKYIVRYISSIDDDMVSVWFDAMSINDAIEQALAGLWDIKEITNIYLERDEPEDNTADEVIINPEDYGTVAELGSAVAKELTDGEFDNLPELVADVHDDQTTEECADGQIYEGIDINGQSWSGNKSSYREVLDGNTGSYTDVANDYDVIIITDINESGNDPTTTAKFNKAAFKAALRNGIVHFQFTKKDGTERQAFGTTNLDILEANGISNGTSNGPAREYTSTVTYYDMTSGGWRRFSNKSITLIYDESY